MRRRAKARGPELCGERSLHPVQCVGSQAYTHSSKRSFAPFRLFKMSLWLAAPALDELDAVGARGLLSFCDRHGAQAAAVRPGVRRDAGGEAGELPHLGADLDAVRFVL